MKKIIFLAAFIITSLAANAQMATFQAIYILNFANNTSWPTEDKDKDFIITVIGDNELADALVKLSKTKRVANRKVIIKEVASFKELAPSQIIYLGRSKAAQIQNVRESQRGKQTLIISGKEGHCLYGAGIAFVSKGGKLNFEISPTNIAQHNLSVSKKIITLGTEIQ